MDQKECRNFLPGHRPYSLWSSSLGPRIRVQYQRHQSLVANSKSPVRPTCVARSKSSTASGRQGQTHPINCFVAMEVVQVDSTQGDESLTDENMKHKLICSPTKRFTRSPRLKQRDRAGKFLYETRNVIWHSSERTDLFNGVAHIIRSWAEFKNQSGISLRSINTSPCSSRAARL